MIGAYTSRESWTYKAVFDGFDFKRSTVGQEFLNTAMLKYIDAHCVIEPDFDAEGFVESCIQERRNFEPVHKVPIRLRDKYEYGYFCTSPDSCTDSDYILFNRNQLNFWDGDGVSTWGLEFLVCPSRDRNGKINEIGFRILDTGRVLDAFKWLFAYGGQATYGLQNVVGDSCVVVEGAFDYLALTESGVRNVVGLGSAFINEQHKQFLPKRVVHCFDQDTFGLAQRASCEDYCFFSPSGKDPFEAWQENGYVHLVHVEL